MTDKMPKEIWYGFNHGCYDKPTLTKLNHNQKKYIRADLVPQWQPIETAPKDETEILVLGLAGNVYRVTGESAKNLKGHWMPMPSPPKEEQ